MSAPRTPNPSNPAPEAVTLSDIAERCGLSKGSVSRALSMDAEACPLSFKTWERIRRVSQEMGYRVNRQARALASGRSMSIGLVYEGTLPWLDSVYHEIIETFSKTVRQAGYHLALVGLDETDHWQDALLGGQVDGCICLHSLPARLERLHPQVSRPIVLLNGKSALASGSVSVDDRRGAALAAEHLLGLGHRRVLMWTDTIRQTPHHSIGERQAGFLRSMRAASGAEPSCFEGDAASFTAAWSSWSASGSTPTAVVCYSHVEAVQALRILRRAGADVPGDVSLVSFNDVYPVAELDPALTCVSTRSAEIGRRGGRMVLDLLAGQAGMGESSEVLIDPRLIERESSASTRG